ncbi:MAG TPA: SRPBCC family protein [Candidatus Binatia bacterium]|nr:SRPBCC family protein [Candidatus Binatia bacterium]
MTTTMTDRIEKHIQLNAPRSRVWRAITDSKEFGEWFQCVFEDPFRPGARIQGRITYPGYENVTMNIVIERIEPERLFSFRWHPNSKGPGADTSKEPTTLVEFTLEERDGGTLLKLVESGFDGIPIERRAAALKSNDGGWTQQMTAIESYLRRNP